MLDESFSQPLTFIPLFRTFLSFSSTPIGLSFHPISFSNGLSFVFYPVSSPVGPYSIDSFSSHVVLAYRYFISFIFLMTHLPISVFLSNIFFFYVYKIRYFYINSCISYKKNYYIRLSISY